MLWGERRFYYNLVKNAVLRCIVGPDEAAQLKEGTTAHMPRSLQVQALR